MRGIWNAGPVPTLAQSSDVAVLDLGDGENRFHPDWMAELGQHLDRIEDGVVPRALVTTATGKFFSNGLVVERLSGPEAERDDYLREVERLLGRVLALPMITVAAVQGHAFGGGAMLALAHDFRVMRADRGFWCLPETDLGLSFTPGMAALIRARLAPQVAHEAMVTSRRYGGTEAVATGIVDSAVAADEVREHALSLAAQLTTKAGDGLGATKARMYAAALGLLGHRPARP